MNELFVSERIYCLNSCQKIYIIIMLQLLISFFSGCVFITKQPSAILSTDKPDNFSYVRSQTEGSHQPANEFDIVPSKTPCWLQSPKNCDLCHQNNIMIFKVNFNS